MRAFSHFHLSKSAVLAFGALAALVAVPATRAADTFDAQIPFSFTSLTLVTPTGVAVAANGTVYIADPGLGSVVQIVPTTGTVTGTAKGAASLAATVTKLTTGLTVPTAVAVDSKGNLYAADATDHKVIELPNPVTSSTPGTITYPGTENPVALAVDPNNNLYIADETQGAIYKVLSGATVGTKVTITLPKIGMTTPALKPVGLAADSAGDIYFANENSTKADNIVYEYTAATGDTAVFLNTPGAGDWDFSGTAAKYPIGMGFDPAGDLYVMDSGSGNLIEITPAAANNYQIPLSSAVTPTGMAVSTIGNLYISDNAGNTADEIFYNNNPFNFGSIPAGTNSPAVTVNFLFSTAPTNPVIYQSMQGGITTEFSSTDSATHITNDCATSCSLGFYVTYSSNYSGTRNGVVGLTDSNEDLLTVPNTGISEASSLALYPGTQSILSQASRTLYEPQGLAVTGNNGTLFVADEGQLLSGGTVTYTHGAVWEYTITAGFPVGSATKVGSFTTPDALALDKAGNLYVADYGGSNGTTPSVTKMPVSNSSGVNAWNGFGTALTLTGSAALNHPMALAFDPWGNLYIGDMGSAGVDATASTPGYIVEVPADGGPAVRLNYSVGGVPIVFPDALAFDSYGNLYIADGGDGDTDLGGVDVVPAGTGTPAAISFTSLSTPLNEPSGLGFDAANDLYVLDGFNQRVLVVPMSFPGGVPTPSTDISLLGQGNSGLSTVVTPSNLVVWPGGQSITISDIGYQPASGTGSPTQVLTLQAVNESGGDASAGPVSYTGIDVGNEEIHFETPGNTNSASFALSKCGLSGTTLAIGATTDCTPTVTFIGTTAGEQGTTITLKGDAATDYSGLGNTIVVTGELNEPVAGLSAPTVSFSASNTATLSNTGNQTLDITNIQVSGDATRATGGTCPLTSGTLAANSTCTINFTINGIFSTGTVTVTDNSGNVPGSQQSASTFYLFSFGFAVPAGGGIGSGFNALTLPAVDVPRDLLNLNQDTSNSSNASTQTSNKKGSKRSH